MAQREGMFGPACWDGEDVVRVGVLYLELLLRALMKF